MLTMCATVPPVYATIPVDNNPSVATNTMSAPNPNVSGGDLVATIALLANMLASVAMTQLGATRLQELLAQLDLKP